ncbi:hypothetical protein QEN19_003149 [Hanseniaspora menglaensis]
MVLLKKKHSSESTHSRKSSTNSVSGNLKLNIYTANNVAANTVAAVEESGKSNQHYSNNSPMSPAPNVNQTITRNGSRLSSAPISGSSANKRFSLSLRSFSSNNSLSHNNSKEDLNTKNSTKANGKNDIPSVSSPSTIKDSKLIFDWDVTDPKAWSWQRVIIWLQMNEFSSKWISFFRRSQISGNDFLKLMAYENFVKIEKYLPSAQNSTYNRFQHLLKRTMEHNVIYQQHSHSRSASSLESSFSRKSSHSKHLRTNSDQVSIGSNLKNISTDKLAELSEGEENVSKITDSSSLTIKASDDNSSPINRSKAMSVPILSEQATVPKLNIPVPPTERKSKKSTVHKNDTFNALYRRSFISIKGQNVDNPVVDLHAETANGTSSNKESITTSSSKRNSPVLSPGNSSYTFFKKYHKNVEITNSPVSTKSSSTLKVKEPEIDAKYLPKIKLGLCGDVPAVKQTYVFCTKDQQSFIPINVSNVKDASTFKAALASHNNINHKNYSIFLIDHEFVIAETALIDDIITELINDKFRNDYNLFFIKNHLKIQLNRNRSNSSMISQPRKMSLKSNVSKISVSSSDLDEIDYGGKYNKIPTNILESNGYQEHLQASKPRTRRATINTKLSSNNNNSDNKSSSFKVIRPDTTHKIDFNEKRETPFVKLNPTREAPPPPPSSSRSIVPIPLPVPVSIKSGPKLPPRPPPPSNLDLDIPNLPPRPNFNRKPSTVSLSHRTSTTSLSKVDHGHTRLSRSNSSIQSSVIISPPRLLKRASSKRIVSSALAGGDTFGENKISFDDAPPFSDTSDSSDISDDIADSHFLTKNISPTQSLEMFDRTLEGDKDLYLFKDIESDIDNDDDDGSDDSGIAWIKNSDLNNRSSDGQKKNLLGNEISSDDHQIEESEHTTSDSDHGIVWTTQKPHKIPNNNQKKVKNLLGNEFNDDFIVNENRFQEDDKNGFSFDSDSILGSLVNEIEENSDDVLAYSLSRKMTLRPSADLVYKNLEVYFPGTDLDKPIFEGSTPPASPNTVNNSHFSKSNNSNSNSINSNSINNNSINSNRNRSIIEVSTIKHSSEKDDYTFSSKNSTPNSSTNSAHKHQPPKRTKTLRILANEALAVRKKKKEKKVVTDSSTLRRSDTTKLWGTKVIEITDKEKIVAINTNKNSKGQYKEFAWIKGEVIGKGSFGCVYLGMNLTTGEMIAVKQVESSTDSQIEALRSEMETLKDLDHLNIVQYLGFEAKNNVYSLFLEYVAGGSVGALIRIFGRFDDVLIRFLNHQVLEGLSYLHNLGILHRDMKADNLLLDLDGVCKISDFGISKKSNDIYSNAEMTMTGTIFWMAPEMVDTKQGYSAKVDIWSLGCIVLEMFAGKRPWSNLEVVAAMFKIGKYKSAPPIPKDTLPLVSEEGINFLELCFQIDPEQRPTADFLLQNKIFEVDSSFKFSETDLAKFTNQNHKTMSLPIKVK